MKELVFLLRVLFGAVLRAFFPAMFAEARDSARDKAENAAPQTELKNRLSQRIRTKWGRQALTGGAMLAVCLVLAGCGTKTIFVPSGDPVRLREPIKNAAVWVVGQDGEAVPATLDLPAGWYCLPDPGDKAEPEKKPEVTAEPIASPLGIVAPPNVPVVTGTPALVTRTSKP